MVLLILALIWAVVLIPPAIRNRAEGRPSDSITAFRRQLAVLNRAGPRRSPGASSAVNRPLRSVSPQGGVALATRPARVTTRAARSQARRRRRDILTGLLAAAGATLIVGAIPALRWVWALHVAVDVLLVAYVALLIRQRNLAAEQALKVRFLPGPRPIDDEAWSHAESAWLAN